MKRWWLVVGSNSWWFDDLEAAKKQARKYENAYLYECCGEYKFIRYCSNNGSRLVRID